MDGTDIGIIASAVMGGAAGIALQVWLRRRKEAALAPCTVGRPLNIPEISNQGDDAFVADLRLLFGRRVGWDRDFARDLYNAISQVTWTHQTKGESGFSYRSADYVLHELGCPWDFYMEESGRVTAEIEAALFDIGWHHEPTTVMA